MTTKTPEITKIDDKGIKLDDEILLDMYWRMLRSRRLDERVWAIHRQGKIAFHISGMGHEAIQVAMGYAINRGYDYVHAYYRDLALVLMLGVTPRDFMISLYGKEGELSSGARQMPSHWSNVEQNLVTASSPVTTQVPQAAGMALASKLRGEDRVTLVTLGEGSTSEGDFHEGMNWAGIHKLPFICVVQNNIYAISVPLELQMAILNVADRAPAYGVEGVVVDGNDVLACYKVMSEAVELARGGGGATLVEAKTYRIVPHSSDDDDRSYRTREEVEAWKEADPITRYQDYLLNKGILTDESVEEYEVRAKAEVDDALAFAEAAPYPPPEAALGDVFAPLEE
jgi:2-oxoisovalerate dehydrogenase E1 component alpha subunit